MMARELPSRMVMDERGTYSRREFTNQAGA